MFIYKFAIRRVVC